MGYLSDAIKEHGEITDDDMTVILDAIQCKDHSKVTDRQRILFDAYCKDYNLENPIGL